MPRSSAWWKQGDGSGCRGHARRRLAADMLPAAANAVALPASYRCRPCVLTEILNYMLWAYCLVYWGNVHAPLD